MIDPEFVSRVRARIEKGWCQKAPARDASLKETSAWSPSATQWCLVGAIAAEAHYRTPQEIREQGAALRTRLYETLPGSIVDWNDAYGRTKEEVLEALDRVLEPAEVLV